MKILFLDIDGVLNSREYDRRRNWSEQSNIDKTRLPLLKRIIESTGAKIVLISSWRSHWNSDGALCDGAGRYMNDLFAEYGLSVYDKTPCLAGARRKDEVAAWLSAHAGEVENFAILDDCAFGWEELSGSYIHTNPHFGMGLEEEQAAEAIKLLNGGVGL